MRTLFIGLATLLSIALVGVLGFYIFFTSFVDSYEQGYKFNSLTGETVVMERTGRVIRWPLVEQVHHVDLRPFQVCMGSSTRVLNCKLVRFNPKGILLFLQWHGRDNYDTVPFVLGGDQSRARDSSTPFTEIMKAYAYDPKKIEYPFLEVLPSSMDAGEAGPVPAVKP